MDIEAVTAAFGTVDVTARGRAAGAACPDCGRSSNRVHDSYQRKLKDLPLAEQSVVIHLTVRCFICSTDNCPRRTFAEPFAQLTAPYARFTTRLGHVLERVGLALAGRAGARLTAHLGVQVGRMTLLRKVVVCGGWHSADLRGCIDPLVARAIAGRGTGCRHGDLETLAGRGDRKSVLEGAGACGVGLLWGARSPWPCGRAPPLLVGAAGPWCRWWGQFSAPTSVAERVRG
ncbi:transposase family protein [Streptomyces sp. NPDC090798]|uniref:transposase family protein n=1 Tax=Streptomyces sp. NPDC090798 TaxID=3365968 RepID=UPI003804D995